MKRKESKYDIHKLARAIQRSQTNLVGLCAMTEFNCALCGQVEIWHNMSVPKMCNTCATKMAENIITRGYDLDKEEN